MIFMIGLGLLSCTKKPVEQTSPDPPVKDSVTNYYDNQFYLELK